MTKTTCAYCYGKGKRTETRVEQDIAQGVVFGSMLGTGYFPMTKVVSEDVTCIYCNGTGER